METATALNRLASLLYENPVLLAGIDLVIKSTLVIVLTLLASRFVTEKAASSSQHLLWMNSVLCLALIPFVAIVLNAIGKETFLANTVFMLTVLPGPVTDPSTVLPITRSWSAAILLVYLVPFSLLLIRVLVSTIVVSGISRRAKIVTDSRENDMFRLVKLKMGLSRTVVIKLSKEVTSPFSFGLLSPEIILPIHTEDWSDSTLEDVLVHELSHIKRFDWLTMLLCHVVASIYWFNPLCWISIRRVNEEAENSCDATVLNLGKKNTEYAENLLQIARRSRDNHRLLVQMIADKRLLPKRVNQILENNMNHYASRKFLSFLVISLVALLATLGNTQFITTQAQQSDLDEEMFPITTVTPQYPTYAATQSIEGWTQVKFTVDSNGNVVENSIVVVDAEPAEVFDSSSMRAIAQFKFSPRVSGGVAVDVPNVQYVFRYVLDDSTTKLPPGRQPPATR